MAFITDYLQLNDASTQANWNAVNFDTPTLNDDQIPVKIYIEGSSCMDWFLKSGQTDGYTYTDVIPATVSITGRLCVGWMWYPLSDISVIPIQSIYMRVSSSTGFTTNYGQWDALSQIISPYNTPISGHTPIMVYPTNPDATNGTPNYGSLESVGYVATTGGNADGKQGGFDMIFAIGWIGVHSETHTNTFFDELYEQSYNDQSTSPPTALPNNADRPLGIISRAGDFFQSNVKFQLGDGTSDTANTVVDETGKTIFFSNVEPEHELGYVFVDPASTHEVRLTLTDCVHFWTSQQSTHDIFTDAVNATYFKLSGCAFANGGAVDLPAHTTNRYTRNCKFDSCGEIDVGDHDFTGNTISNATSGALYTVPEAVSPNITLRASGNNWSNNTAAIRVTGTGPLTLVLDNETFSGNTYDIDWAGSGTLTVQNNNGSNASTYTATASPQGTVVFVNNPVTTTVNTIDAAGTAIPSVYVHLVAATSSPLGPLPVDITVTITRAGSPVTATVSQTAHGFSTGQKVLIKGANEWQYNGVKTITATTVNSYDYALGTDPGGNATGTITATAVIVDGLSDGSGQISDTRALTANQSVTGWARKSTSSPFYKEAPLTGTIDKDNGVTLNAIMTPDE